MTSAKSPLHILHIGGIVCINCIFYIFCCIVFAYFFNILHIGFAAYWLGLLHILAYFLSILHIFTICFMFFAFFLHIGHIFAYLLHAH